MLGNIAKSVISYAEKVKKYFLIQTGLHLIVDWWYEKIQNSLVTTTPMLCFLSSDTSSCRIILIFERICWWPSTAMRTLITIDLNITNGRLNDARIRHHLDLYYKNVPRNQNTLKIYWWNARRGKSQKHKQNTKSKRYWTRAASWI